ncbi:polysaccharide deacetylase family protein [Arthrobacter sp. CJ23]|uniref:polysaccharide deacetylase family protein n=1 Tax=Arthrobacter sp. CJ23 TaxID=2972479 RepID=UPI00215C58BF|nr:polysaccharide deacetylase family protein [Arthrobacter sp. CJ23]UVJ40075.1 polysaccharide deacetylase family protein [Arthrobacter sp. CJ23]
MAAAPNRRAAIGVLGASLLASLNACAAPATTTSEATPSAGVPASGAPSATARSTAAGTPGATPALTAATPTATPTPTPTVTKRIRRTFIPDLALPPVRNGLAPVITRIQTKRPVVFLTIDDGNTKTPEMVRLMAEYDYPASLFLTKNAVQGNPTFFKAFQAQGSLIENHTVSHNVNMVRQWSYQQQLNDIEGMQQFATEQYGRRPTLFRPPGGAYSGAMQQAVAAAGMKAIVTWEAKANAGRMDYQVGNSLRPGDIVLMHFRPEFAADLAAFRAAQLAAGLEVVLLEDFLGVA